MEPFRGHVFVIYHAKRKSLWRTHDTNDATHLLGFLVETQADFSYYPPEVRA